jgi:hypothetical protein
MICAFGFGWVGHGAWFGTIVVYLLVISATDTLGCSAVCGFLWRIFVAVIVLGRGSI